MTEKAAILIVNGGKDPEKGKWLQLCIDKIIEHTEWKNYQIYVWNNNIEDNFVSNFLRQKDNVTLIEANASEKLEHIHAVPLQRLYELAHREGAKYIITMDSDAHPLQKGWLTKLISSLNNQVVLAGVWRDELKKAISPYIHASCLCTTVDFIENNNLRLDFIAPNTETETHDTLSSLTEKSQELNLKTHKLYRSNKNNFHRLMGGIYGDLIYHHGAGSRVFISFWDELDFNIVVEDLQNINLEISYRSTELLFIEYQKYMQWLQGDCSDKNFDLVMKKLKKLSQTNLKLLKYKQMIRQNLKAYVKSVIKPLKRIVR